MDAVGAPSHFGVLVCFDLALPRFEPLPPGVDDPVDGRNNHPQVRHRVPELCYVVADLVVVLAPVDGGRGLTPEPIRRRGHLGGPPRPRPRGLLCVFTSLLFSAS